MVYPQETLVPLTQIDIHFFVIFLSWVMLPHPQAISTDHGGPRTSHLSIDRHNHFTTATLSTLSMNKLRFYHEEKSSRTIKKTLHYIHLIWIISNKTDISKNNGICCVVKHSRVISQIDRQISTLGLPGSKLCPHSGYLLKRYSGHDNRLRSKITPSDSNERKKTKQIWRFFEKTSNFLLSKMASKNS